tara:strand:+ start:137 stop:595 length:459 start_codon:yes stop_codon:yes gene_type:complete
MKYEIECDCVEERTPRVIPVLKETLKDNHEIYVLLCDRCFEDHKEVMRCEFSEEEFENERIREFYNLENISDGVKSDKDLELNKLIENHIRLSDWKVYAPKGHAYAGFGKEALFNKIKSYVVTYYKKYKEFPFGIHRINNISITFKKHFTDF